MAFLIAITLFTALAAAITWFGYRRYARPARVYDQLGGSASIPMPVADGIAQGIEPDLPVRVMELVGEKIPVSPEDAAIARRDLIAAGYRSDNAVTVYYGIRVLAAILLVLLSLWLRQYLSSPVLRLLIIAVAGGIGWMGPSFVLDRLVARRHERLRCSLPDALDLLVISVEAGLALDQAIDHVGREMAVTHRDLSDELRLVTLEMRAGKRRSDALRNLGERTGHDELRKLVAILIQTDKFGTSIAESLRTHSDFMRVRRRQEAEERAGKVGVKLVFPIFFFILPTMFVLAAGPSMLQISKNLLPMMRQIGNTQ